MIAWLFAATRTAADNVQDRIEGVGSTDPIEALLYLITLSFWAVITWQAIEFEFSRALFGVIVLGGCIAFYTVSNLVEARQDGQTLRAVGMLGSLVVGAGVTTYVVANFDTLQNVRVGWITTTDFALAIVFILTILYLTYDAYGGMFFAVVTGIILYSLYGNFVPFGLGHGGLPLDRAVQMGMLEFRGVYGSLTQVMGTLVAPFLLFAGVIRMYGGFALIIRFAVWFSKYSKSGIVQMAVISSMIIGSITGSALANTSITGSFTIPTISSTGVAPKTAAAIESMASSGGQIMPPVMGVAAFLMADILQRSVVDIFVAAAIPALVFYFVLLISVNRIGKQTEDEDVDIMGTAMDAMPDMQRWMDDALRPSFPGYKLLEAAQFVVPFVYLLYLLGVERMAVLNAGMYASGLLVVFGAANIFLRNLSGRGVAGLPDAATETLRQTSKGLRDGLDTLAPLAIIVASIGVLVDLLFTTGVPARLSYTLIDISGGVLAILLVLTMALSIALGMGMPTTAAYLVVALLIAPNLIDFGIDELSAHFFVFYFAILSVITPPIAPGIVIASGIADSDFWETCVEAVKISLPIYVLPFAFVYNPALVTPNPTTGTLVVAVLALLGAAVMVYSIRLDRVPVLDRPIEHRPTRYGVRGALLVVGIAIMINPV